MIQLTDRELGAILAGLRRHQQDRLMYTPVGVDDIYDIETNGGLLVPLSNYEIDDLCERLNNPYQIPIEFTRCPTCKTPGAAFVDGDCPECNPLITCAHRVIDDCMFCITCGECREDLFEDDECPDCKK